MLVVLALLTLAAAPSDKTKIDWVRIPGGSFLMGSDEYPQEGPIRRVTVKAFELGRTEVTNRQYQACVAAGACTGLDMDCLGPAFRGPEQPVVCVTWAQARAFAAWAGGRLPSEAEWEYAARGAGEQRRYPWGGAAATCRRAVFGEDPDALGCGRDAAWPVCSKPAGNSKQGLCDMAGNVWEWTEDWYHDNYEGAPSDGSAWLEKSTSSFRSDRGGQWDGDAHNLRATTRDSEDPEIRSERGTGFRTARDLKAP
ncbi:MAG: formylglycine-generating enzyme family protein [Elusimicrobiota bacterium]|nr:formylglycine-generating enzyme family protein [Elusimicrobiota bacterium]